MENTKTTQKNINNNKLHGIQDAHIWTEKLVAELISHCRIRTYYFINAQNRWEWH